MKVRNEHNILESDMKMDFSGRGCEGRRQVELAEYSAY
jgi:hypothetical protein